MKAVNEFICSLLVRPAERIERLTPWILAVLGGVFLLIMIYGYCMAAVMP